MTKATTADTAYYNVYTAACAATNATKEEYKTAYAAAFEPGVTHAVHLFDVALETLCTECFGRFPVQSISGNQYIMCAYHVGANVILVAAYQTTHDRHWIPAHNKIMEQLK